MEIIVLVVTLIALDLLAARFGADSRESHAIDHHERAIAAARIGDLGVYRLEVVRIERESEQNDWRLF